MNQESLENIIERLQRDRQTIRERMNERNQLFDKANQNYQSNLQRELQTIKLINKQAEQRDLEFREYIIQLFKSYDEGTQQMKQTIQQTIQEKINYNEYLIKNYPPEYEKEKKELQKENISLRNKIESFIQQQNTLAVQSIPLIEIQHKDQEDLQILDKFLGEQQETNIQSQQINHIFSPQATQQQIFIKPKVQEQTQSNQFTMYNTTSKKVEKDFLSEFLLPIQGKQV